MRDDFFSKSIIPLAAFVIVVGVTGAIMVAFDLVQEPAVRNKAEEIPQPVSQQVSQPDLVTTSIYIFETSLVAGKTLTPHGIVGNQGNADAGPFEVGFSMDGFELGPRPIQFMSAGTSTSQSVAWIATAGPHTLEVCADYYNDVSEASETNNCASERFSVP